jgi:hypothetical protein
METMDNVLVSFHGRGKLIQGTSSPNLPHTPIFPNNPVLASHQVGGSLPWPDTPMGVESRAPGSLSLSQEAPQKKEIETTKQDRRPSTQEKVPHADSYLLPLALITFKVGCCVEYSMRHLRVALTIKRCPTSTPLRWPLNYHTKSQGSTLTLTPLSLVSSLVPRSQWATALTSSRTSSSIMARTTQKWKGYREG